MAADHLHLRPPQRIPQHLEKIETISLDPLYVSFKHPGYPNENNNTFLTLAALDGVSGGLYLQTAKVACGILAANRWDGFFTLDRAGNEKIDEEGGLIILPPDDYYFHLPGQTPEATPYPFVPTFSQWPFPHNQLPESWEALGSRIPTLLPRLPTSTSNALLFRDATCRMSGHAEATDNAHLSPVAEDGWFHEQGMAKYIYDKRRPGPQAVYDVNNLFLLRSDLHRSFDKGVFAFVPKQDAESKETKYVVHMLSFSQELARLYHNVELHPLPSVPKEFILARLAWTLFPLLEGFLLGGIARQLVLQKTGARSFCPEECNGFVKSKGARSRTNSPTKRSRKDNDEQNQKVDNEYQEVEEEGGASDIGRHQTSKHSSGKRRRESPDMGIQGDAEVVDVEARPMKLAKLSHPIKTLVPVHTVAVNNHSSPSSPSSPRPFHANPGLQLSRNSPSRDQGYDSPNSSPTISTDTHESSHLQAMREQALEAERARSDPHGHWVREYHSAQEALMKVENTPAGMMRIWEVLRGWECRDAG